MTQYMNAKKIALVYPNLPHYRYGVFKELDEHLNNLLFISGEASRDGSIADIPLGSFNKVQKVENKWFGPFLWQKGLSKALRQYNPDAVIFLGDARHLSTWAQALLARFRKQRVYFWTIGWHRPDTGFHKYLRTAFYRTANKLLLYGNYGRDLGIKAGFPEDRMTVIYNSWGSLANAKSVELTPSTLPTGERPVIGAVIRLSPGKGLSEIVKAIAYLRDKSGIEVDGLIIGEGPERARLKALAAELNVSLFLPGAVYSSDDLKKIYKQLTVTVVPKAAGLTVIQSLTEGTPVVTISDPYQQMPEFEAITNGVTGSLIEDTDASSIAEACAFWIGKIQSSPASTEAACHKVIEEYWSPSAQAGHIIDVLKKEVGSL